VAAEYFAIPLVGLFLRTTQAIPTRRSGRDTAATRTAIRYAAQGELVGILPEGRINVTDQLMLSARPGAAMIALAAQVPVVPCYIEGSPYASSPWSPLWTPARVRLVFGDPIYVDEYVGREREPELLQQLTLRFMREIARLAGQYDFQPQLAGRSWKGPPE
jgi:1-acyl-sn-glycerol-3-phosphate acyltransferase